MNKKILGVLLMCTPLILVLSGCIVILGLEYGIYAFFFSMLATAIITLCVAKGIDLLGE